MQGQVTSSQKHEIQLESIGIVRMDLDQRTDIMADDEQLIEQLTREAEKDLTVACGLVDDSYRQTDSSTYSFEVDFILSVGKTIENPIYSFTIVSRGRFVVDPSKFNVDKIPSWSSLNGFYIMLPFVRQFAFDLTKYYQNGPYIVPLITFPERALPDTP